MAATCLTKVLRKQPPQPAEEIDEPIDIALF